REAEYGDADDGDARDVLRRAGADRGRGRVHPRGVGAGIRLPTRVRERRNGRHLCQRRRRDDRGRAPGGRLMTLDDTARADAVYEALLARAGEAWVEPRRERTARLLEYLDDPQRTY